MYATRVAYTGISLGRMGYLLIPLQLPTFALFKNSNHTRTLTMSTTRRIKTALISVFDKDGLAPILTEMKRLGIQIITTGGTQRYIEAQGMEVTTVESLTDYPSILDGRVKTLHPKVHGGILARRNEAHRAELAKYDLPEIDLVVVDLYPFEQTVAQTDDHEAIIEKIDIGGIALIRAAAKNFGDVTIVPSKEDYDTLLHILTEQNGETSLQDRQRLARRAFGVSSHYDTAIFGYFDRTTEQPEEAPDSRDFKRSVSGSRALRYGENPHQAGRYYGDLEEVFEVLGGKPLSYNNLVDVDAAVRLMYEFRDDRPTFAILKHTNACGVATRPTLAHAYRDALAGDPISAFGGILIANTTLDYETAEQIHGLFYEVLIAPAFDDDALELLSKKKKRVLLRLKEYPARPTTFKSLLNGVIEQDSDLKIESVDDLETVTKREPTRDEIEDLLFANKLAKHLKSNTIVLARNSQLLGMGCGQTSRVDALKQAIVKAQHFDFHLDGAVMASDAFFPFPDCVQIADEAGIRAVIQPGGSIKDQDSIDYCDANDMAMVTTGVRHFLH